MNLTRQWSKDSGVIGEMACIVIEIDKDNHKDITLFELKIEYILNSYQLHRGFRIHSIQ